MKDYVQYLNLNDSLSFQEVYGSQVYGTYYSVQAKFNTVAKEHPLGDYYLESIDFEVINYKGTLDIGIVEIEGPEVFENCIDDETFKLIHLKMRAMHLHQNIQVPEYQKSLVMNKWINKNDIIHISRTLIELHDDSVALDYGIFDSEFFYREGLRQANDYPRINPAPKKNPLINIINDDPNNVSGTLCTEKTNRIM